MTEAKQQPSSKRTKVDSPPIIHDASTLFNTRQVQRLQSLRDAFNAEYGQLPKVSDVIAIITSPVEMAVFCCWRSDWAVCLVLHCHWLQC